MINEPIAARGNRNVLVQMQRLSQELVHDVNGRSVYFCATVKQGAKVGCVFLKYQLPSGVRIVSPEASYIQFPEIQHMRPRGEVELDDRRLIVDASYESNLGVKILLGHAMACINVEPIISKRQASSEGGIIA